MKPVVHIVDDDRSFRTATARLLTAHGLKVEAYESGDQFLACLPDGEPGCVLLDLQMPGKPGLQVQREIRERAPLWPIVFLTGEGDISASVEAMKAGAEDFLEKCTSAAVMLATIERALSLCERQRAEYENLQERRTVLASLSTRETEVLGLVIRGKLNKQMAYALGISERTVKVHRHRMMEKLGVKSVAELISIATSLGVVEPNLDGKGSPGGLSL
ncbi:response regulator transcription factor [Rhizobium grahamii]|uniref:DNA-binding response regulator n=2 Tax=Rhizobium grahamii TaxID=1120045 RepID=A0A370KGV4_9HYPH|nr:response regulator [Rhizobium grahamii]EPE96788.1 putative two-component response regulator transcriptional regulator [Rhizobium grahamii CCGE 502]RDJ04005.1 DNA-binding response regulator [Rhizobium grahamii]